MESNHSTAGWSRAAQEATFADELREATVLAAEGREQDAVNILAAAESSASRDTQRLAAVLETATRLLPALTGDSLTRCEETVARLRVTLGGAAQPESRTPSALRRNARRGIPVSTSNDVPGFIVTDYVGEVFGLVVRARGTFPQVGAKLKSMVGGELETMTNLLHDTRTIAVQRMVEDAEARGANAIIAMRIDVQEMEGSWTEICAYGTAVRAEKASADRQ